MKIKLSGEHNGVTKTICTYEYAPLTNLSPEMTKKVDDELAKAIMEEIFAYMKMELKND